MYKIYFKRIPQYVIIVLLLLLSGCFLEMSKPPSTELFFDSFDELYNFMTSGNVKILEPDLTEAEILEKHQDIIESELILLYYRNYIYVDLEDDSIVDRCYEIYMHKDDVASDDIQGLPFLSFIYQTEFEGLKGIVFDISPVKESKRELINNAEYASELNPSVIKNVLQYDKHIKGYEPKKFVESMNDDVDIYSTYVKDIKLVVYFFYEELYDRSSINFEYETKIMDYVINNLKILEIS